MTISLSLHCLPVVKIVLVEGKVSVASFSTTQYCCKSMAKAHSHGTKAEEKSIFLMFVIFLCFFSLLFGVNGPLPFTFD